MFQDSVLFDATIAENIRAGKPDASDEEVVSAARQAEIHAFIMGLPGQYNTRVGELGLLLSGGQRQRMAIARAIIRKPALIVLDEATSSLDPATENAVNQTLAGLKGRHTIISVTHRLQSAADMDRIKKLLAKHPAVYAAIEQTAKSRMASGTRLREAECRSKRGSPSVKNR